MLMTGSTEPRTRSGFAHCVFVRMPRMRDSTVRSDSTSRPAICRLDSAWSSRAAASRSRLVNGFASSRSTVVRAASRPAAATVRVRSAVCCSDCARSSTDRASDYGSEGWGFESLRARPGHRPVARPAAGFLAASGATPGATRTYQPPNSARLIDSAAARLSPSSRCPYTSLVMAMLAWPSTSETTCSGVPCASISEAPEWRSSCGCQ